MSWRQLGKPSYDVSAGWLEEDSRPVGRSVRLSDWLRPAPEVKVGLSWDPDIQRHRNDLAYSVYMLRRRHRRLTSDVTKHGLQIEEEAERLGHRFLPKLTSSEVRVKPWLAAQYKTNRKPAPVTRKLPPIKAKANISVKTMDFFDNIPLTFIAKDKNVDRG